jgi:predicted MFS family arabinose efflux permease
VIGFSETLIFAITQALGRPASFIGVLGAMQGVGSVVGGITAARVLRRLGDLRTAGVGIVLFAAADVLWLVLSLPMILASMAVAGLGIVWAVVALSTAYQRRSPQHMQGRVAAASNMLFSVPQTISIATGAALISIVDYRVEIVAMAIGTVLSAAYLLTRRAREPEATLELAA